MNDIARSIDLLNSDLYDALSISDQNIVYSPWGVHMLLSLFYEGSAGHTEIVLKQYLRLPRKIITAKEYEEILKSLSKSTRVTMEVATKLYAAQGYHFAKNFTEVARRYFEAETASFDVKRPGSIVREVNNWMKTHTYGKISHLVDERDFDSNFDAILLNAVYFHAAWLFEFDEDYTTTEPFYVSANETVNCEMMAVSNDLYYRKDPDLDAEILKLKFHDERFSFFVILPSLKTGIEELEKSFTKAHFTNFTSQPMDKSIVHVHLPRFKIESRYELREPLRKVCSIGRIGFYSELTHLFFYIFFVQ